MAVAGQSRQRAFSCRTFDACLDAYLGPAVWELRHIGTRLIGGRSCCIRVEWNRSEFYGLGCNPSQVNKGGGWIDSPTYH